MLKNFLGDDVFIHGLQQYLKDHAFGNAETNDLWQSFTNVSFIVITFGTLLNFNTKTTLVIRFYKSTNAEN